MKFYIDPGTGSMLFTILIGVIGAGVYSLRMLLIKLRFILGGGKAESYSKNEIPFVVFSDDKRYWTVFEPIMREMNARGKDVLYLTCSEEDPALKCEYEHIKAEYAGNFNRAFARLNFINASVVISTTPGLEVYQWKRSKGVRYYVHIPHAASEITLYRMFGIDYYDAILLSGEYQARDVRALEKLRSLPEKEIEFIGIPYMDEMAKRLRARGACEPHERTVLLAPSWGKSAIFSVYGAKMIDALLATGYHVIIRPHPQSFKSETELIEGLMEKYPNSDQLEWNRDVDNFDVLFRSDILISDFSGVIFDFALVYDKPVIYTDPKFDLSMYDAWWLDYPIWTTEALPRLGMLLCEDNMENIKDLIDTTLTDPKFEEGRRSVKAETWMHQDKGAVRAADYLISKYEELTCGKEEDKR